MSISDIKQKRNLFENYVKPAVEDKCRLTCGRTGSIYKGRGITQEVWEKINSARVIIADVVGGDADVFYKIGIAHTLGKPVILVAQSINDVPPDFWQLRCILYDVNKLGSDDFQERLQRAIRGVLSGHTRAKPYRGTAAKD